MSIILKNSNIIKPANDYATDLPPGEYDATCIDVIEKRGVERSKFQSRETERVDVIAFKFALTGKAGGQREVRTREMRISLHPMSALYGFLSAWFGKPPEDKLNTDDLLGCSARLTLAHTPSATEPGKIYVRVVGIAPAGIDRGVVIRETA